VLQIRRGVPMTIRFEPAQVPDGNGFRLEAGSFAGLLRGEKNAWSGAPPARIDRHRIDARRYKRKRPVGG
jgi:hypothetical protein